MLTLLNTFFRWRAVTLRDYLKWTLPTWGLIFKPFGWPDDVMQFRLPLDLPRKPCNVWLGGRHFPFQPTPASMCSLSGVWYCSVPISPATSPSLMCILSLASPTRYRNPAPKSTPNTITGHYAEHFVQVSIMSRAGVRKVMVGNNLKGIEVWALQSWWEVKWKRQTSGSGRSQHSSKIFYWGISPSTTIFPFSI